MTRKKMRSRLSFPNHEQKTTAFPLAGRHLLEVENCKIASFFYGFPLPSKLCLLSLTQLVSNRLDGMYILMRSSENIFHISISVSFSTFTFLMTGDNYQANVVDKTDHMWRTIFILISGGWGGHHGWKLRVSFSLSLSTLSYGEFFRSYEVASPLGLAIFDLMKWQVPWDLPLSKGLDTSWNSKLWGVASPMGLATF